MTGDRGSGPGVVPAGTYGRWATFWAVLAVGALFYFLTGAVASLLDRSWVQAAVRLAVAAFLAGWLVRQYGFSARRWRTRATADGDAGRRDAS